MATPPVLNIEILHCSNRCKVLRDEVQDFLQIILLMQARGLRFLALCRKVPSLDGAYVVTEFEFFSP